MKALPIISIIIAVVVAINEFGWIEKSSLAWVFIALAVSVILLATYVLGEKQNKEE
jgi:hypothetical protein